MFIDPVSGKFIVSWNHIMVFGTTIFVTLIGFVLLLVQFCKRRGTSGHLIRGKWIISNVILFCATQVWLWYQRITRYPANDHDFLARMILPWAGCGVLIKFLVGLELKHRPNVCSIMSTMHGFYTIYVVTELLYFLFNNSIKSEMWKISWAFLTNFWPNIFHSMIMIVCTQKVRQKKMDFIHMHEMCMTFLTMEIEGVAMLYIWYFIDNMSPDWDGSIVVVYVKTGLHIGYALTSMYFFSYGTIFKRIIGVKRNKTTEVRTCFFDTNRDHTIDEIYYDKHFIIN